MPLLSFLSFLAGNNFGYAGGSLNVRALMYVPSTQVVLSGNLKT